MSILQVYLLLNVLNEIKKEIGSLQKYVSNIGSLTDLSPSLFSVEDVHRIAQLDIRLFNVDRNDENFFGY